MKSFYENLNIDFLKETWYYKVNYLGYAYLMSSNLIERHYIFETHGNKYDLYIDSEGSLKCSKFETINKGIISSYYVIEDTKLQRLSFEDFLECGKKDAIKIIAENFDETEDNIEDIITKDNIASFDKVLVIYKEGGLLSEPYFGVNIINSDLTVRKVSEKDFYEHISKF